MPDEWSRRYPRRGLKSLIRRTAARLLVRLVPEASLLFTIPEVTWTPLMSTSGTSEIDVTARLYPPYTLENCSVGRYTYAAANARMYGTSVGSFCSIGPNVMSGYGVHPTDGVSTSPMFYSTALQNGFTLSATDKLPEHQPVTIGNDVFVGANVTILDGVTIGDGAVIGAGAVVTHDIPPYAIAVGVPAEVRRYRFGDSVIAQLLSIRWWDFDLDGLADVERDFWDVEHFISKHLHGR